MENKPTPLFAKVISMSIVGLCVFFLVKCLSGGCSDGNVSNLPKIQASSYDGSVFQVENFIKGNIKDPDSYQSIKWNKLIKSPEGYEIGHKFRAKNGFGGYDIAYWGFTLDTNGTVIQVIDLDSQKIIFP